MIYIITWSVDKGLTFKPGQSGIKAMRKENPIDHPAKQRITDEMIPSR